MFKTIDAQIDGLKTYDKVQRGLEQDDYTSGQLVKALSKIKLFTAAHASAKLAKNLQFNKYESYILYMSPATLAYQALDRKGTLCAFASQGCAAACLNTAGRGRFSSVANARLRKALYYIVFKDAFITHVFNEVKSLRAKLKPRKKLVIRLNGTTDINWLNIKLNGLTIFETYPDVQFYDYTKNILQAKNSKAYPNYYVTFSASESNTDLWVNALNSGINVAMVFKDKPKVYNGFVVIDGDSHDLRFLDLQVNENKTGFIVGLTAKGKAKQDKTGFVKSCNGPLITQKVVLNFIDTKTINKGA